MADHNNHDDLGLDFVQDGDGDTVSSFSSSEETETVGSSGSLEESSDDQEGEQEQEEEEDEEEEDEEEEEEETPSSSSGIQRREDGSSFMILNPETHERDIPEFEILTPSVSAEEQGRRFRRRHLKNVGDEGETLDLFICPFDEDAAVADKRRLKYENFDPTKGSGHLVFRPFNDRIYDSFPFACECHTCNTGIISTFQLHFFMTNGLLEVILLSNVASTCRRQVSFTVSEPVVAKAFSILECHLKRIQPSKRVFSLKEIAGYKVLQTHFNRLDELEPKNLFKMFKTGDFLADIIDSKIAKKVGYNALKLEMFPMFLAQHLGRQIFVPRYYFN